MIKMSVRYRKFVMLEVTQNIQFRFLKEDICATIKEVYEI